MKSISSDDQWSPPDVSFITEISTTTLQFYVKSKLLKIEDPGRGKSRFYTKQHIFELLIIKALADNGIQLSRIKKIMEAGREEYSEMFDFRTYEKKNAPLYGIYVYEDKTFFGNTSKKAGNLEGAFVVPMKGESAAVLINTSLLFEKIRHH
jgi:DNA-binding transcriptional MerR regulator